MCNKHIFVNEPESIFAMYTDTSTHGLNETNRISETVFRQVRYIM